jgi:hypothetical protein
VDNRESLGVSDFSVKFRLLGSMAFLSCLIGQLYADSPQAVLIEQIDGAVTEPEAAAWPVLVSSGSPLIFIS